MRPNLIAALVILIAIVVAAGTGWAGEPASLDPGERGRVRIDGALWEALQPAPDTPDPALPGPAAQVRQVVLEPGADALLVRATWTLDAFEPGWFDAVLAGPELRDVRVTWDGGPAAWDSGPAGVQITGFVDGPTQVELRGELPGDPFARTSFLRLLPAIRGDVEVLLGDRVVADLDGTGVVHAADRTWWASGPDLQLTLREATPPRDRGTLAVGAVGVGLTISDTELRGRARVRWTLRRGRIERLSLRTAGLGDDLQITGSTVRAVTRSGDRLLVELQATADTSVELDLAWSAPLPTGNEGQLRLPTIVPEGVSRSSSSLQLARDGEWEALPELEGWAPRAGAFLPEWGRGLVEGTPTAAFVTGIAGRGGTISLLRFEPVSGPAVVVEVADHEVAATSEGRLLTRVRYDVVNDRGSYLEILPPFGSLFLTVRVDEEPVVPVRTGGAWRIPLPRSLETVQGLIAVPVEVVLLSEGEPWSRRETRELTLPGVDAPIAASRVTLYLPPGYRETLRNDDSRRVESFTEGEGIAWGFLAEDDDTRNKAAVADLVFKQATEAWLGNEFELAQENLDVLAGMGASNTRTGQLQSNLDVVFEDLDGEPDVFGEGGGQGSMIGHGGGGGSAELDSGAVEFHFETDGKSKRTSSPRSSGEETLRRRIRDQARARGEGEYREYESTRREAERALQEGDLEAAEQRFRRAREVGRQLELYEQEESEEVSQLNADIDRQLAEVSVRREEKEKRLAQVIEKPKAKVPASPSPRKKRAVLKDPYGFGGLGTRGAGAGGGGIGSSVTTGVGSVGSVGDSIGGGVAYGAAGAALGGRSTSTYDFDDDEITGELLKPEERLIDDGVLLPEPEEPRRENTRNGSASAGDAGLRDGRYTIDLPAGPGRSTASPDTAVPSTDAPSYYYEPMDVGEEELGWTDEDFGPSTAEAQPIQSLPPTVAGLKLDSTIDSITLLPGAHQILAVTAATRSVPIPRIGQPIRYQQLLLPAGEAPAVVVRARLPRSEGTPR